LKRAEHIYFQKEEKRDRVWLIWFGNPLYDKLTRLRRSEMLRQNTKALFNKLNNHQRHEVNSLLKGLGMKEQHGTSYRKED
jgi:hypothetical protein